MSLPPSAPRLPLSPASPPHSGLKQQSKSNPSTVPPPTPPSPEPMSVATKRYVPAYEDGGHTNEMANRSPNNYVQNSQRPPIKSHNSQTLQPLQQTNTLKRPAPQDEPDRPDNKRLKKDGEPEEMEVDQSIAPTNHDRHTLSHINASARPILAEASIVQPLLTKPQADLDEIFKDVGPSFRIGRPTSKRSHIDMNKHMLGSFGLHPLLSQVARLDPVTGEKINKLRKSYEGQIKIAALPGKLKAHAEPHEKDEPSKLRQLATMPEEDFVASQTQRKIGDLSGLQDVLHKALQMNPGTMPKETSKTWDEVLGHETKTAAQQALQTASFLQSLQQPPRVPNGARVSAAHSGPSAADKMRTRGNKRSYDDSSFSGYKGYGDGVSDPDEDFDRDTDYADRGKKRRKD